MTRQLGLTLATTVLFAAFLVAQDPPVAAKGDKEPAKKQVGDGKADPKADPKVDPKDNPKGDLPAKSPEKSDREKIVKKLHEEFEEAGTQLEKPDAGDKTQVVQQQIIDDLQKLIDQQDNDKSGASQQANADSQPQGGQPQGGQPQGGQPQGGQPQGGQPQGGQPKGGGQDNKGEAKSQPKGGQKGEDKDKGLAKKGDPKEGNDKKGGDDKKGELAKGPGEKDKKGGKDGGVGGDSKKGDLPPVDLTYAPWGNLPPKERQKMNALASDRMIPRYEELLRQYYRTIAEQGRKKEGE